MTIANVTRLKIAVFPNGRLKHCLPVRFVFITITPLLELLCLPDGRWRFISYYLLSYGHAIFSC